METQKTKLEVVPSQTSGCNVAVIKRGYCNRNRHAYQWNRIRSPEINPHACGQSMAKGARIYNGPKTVSSSDAGKTGQLYVK